MRNMKLLHAAADIIIIDFTPHARTLTLAQTSRGARS